MMRVVRCCNQSCAAVELNNPFYRVPSDETFHHWVERALSIRPGLRYVVKANRYFTHLKQMNVDDNFKTRWADFWRKCELLGPCLGPVLFQFHHRFRFTPANIAKLKNFAAHSAVVSPTAKIVIEFRDPG